MGITEGFPQVQCPPNNMSPGACLAAEVTESGWWGCGGGDCSLLSNPNPMLLGVSHLASPEAGGQVAAPAIDFLSIGTHSLVHHGPKYPST